MFKLLIRLWLTPFLALALLLFSTPGACYSDDEVLATGKGFEITESYVHAVEDFYKAMSFTSTPDQYLGFAIRTKVFALEAQALDLDRVGLGLDREAVTENNVRDLEKVETLVNDLGYSEAYTRHLRKNYNIPGEVIESYFMANWGRFAQGHWRDGDLRSLDDETKDKVRSRILNVIQKRIYEQAYPELIDKYGVVINDQVF